MSQIAPPQPDCCAANENKAHKEVKKSIPKHSLSELLLTIQHDIKSPISNIIGLTNIISDMENLPKRLKQYINYIKTSSEQLLQLISQTLKNYNYINKNQKQIFNLSKLIKDTLKLNIISIKNKQLKINLYQDPNIPKQLIIDKNKLHRIFANLLDNAIKFTIKGSITITTKLIKTINKEQAKYPKAIIELTIIDTGIGIAKNKTRFVFQRFSRLPKKDINAEFISSDLGSGLGLWVVRKLIKEINGKIYIASTKGVGTKFRCVFPCELFIKDYENFQQ
jgi:signal transduction histidine kinase